jgi:putative ABC transport system ATP-binding protein
MIAVRNLVKTIETPAHRVEILRDISFDVPRSQVVAIMGPSGSGKSTLLGLLAGLDWPTSGSVILEGTDITRLDEDEMARLRGTRIGFVFQAYQLIPTLTALENVLLPSDMADGPQPGASGRARDLLAEVGLIDREEHYPSQLSGGEQQRVAIARALAKNPDLLLCDEPTGALDSKTGRLVLSAILRVNRELGATTALITHNAVIGELCDRILTMADGRIASARANPRPRSAEELEW